MSLLKEKSVLVTGACGTIGRALIETLIEHYGVARLVGLDNNESELFNLDQEYVHHDNVKFYLADVRDHNKLIKMLNEIDMVFHTAAFKHVFLCEQSPFEAIQTNIIGVRNIIDAATTCNVKNVIFTSSDKAVNPTNVMGTSKLMGERLITAASSKNRQGPICASTRFGNVLGSRGSVVTVFKEQIKKGGPITLTDPDMTRFIMSVKQAVKLVIDSSFLAQAGEVFVTKMPAIRIQDLAEVMRECLAGRYGWKPQDIAIEIIGAKPGEKLYEELLSSEEIRRTWEIEDYFVVLPAFKDLYKPINYHYPGLVSKTVEKTYISADEQPLTQEELYHFLSEHDIL